MPFLSRALTNEAALGLLELRHAGELAALVERNKAHLQRWLPWVPEVYTERDARAFIKAGLERLAAQNGVVLGIWVRERLVGLIDLHAINWANRSSSIGYWLSEEWQGKGLMTLACEALLTYAFQELELNRIEIRAAVENRRSRAIPERLGFRLEGVLQQAEWLYDRFVDHAVYALLAEEWAEARRGKRSARKR